MDNVQKTTFMKVNEWLRDVYGLNDDDTLDAGEVEELLEDYHNTVVTKELDQQKQELLDALTIEKQDNPSLPIHSYTQIGYQRGRNEAREELEAKKAKIREGNNVLGKTVS